MGGVPVPKAALWCALSRAYSGLWGLELKLKVRMIELLCSHWNMCRGPLCPNVGDTDLLSRRRPADGSGRKFA